MAVIETQTQEMAENLQRQIHFQRANEHALLGYTISIASGIPGVPDGTSGIVPKSSLGVDVPALTEWRWAIPQQNIEGTWFFEDYPSAVLTGVQGEDYARRELPMEWNGVTGGNFNSQFDEEDFDTGEMI